jgi:hypothetical protein
VIGFQRFLVFSLFLATKCFMNATPNLILSVDPGSSLTKTIWQTSVVRQQLLLMEPDVVIMPRSQLNYHQSQLVFHRLPEHNAWIQFQGKVYAVGLLAREQRAFSAPLHDLKYEAAISKVMAAIGVIAVREGLPEHFSVSLGFTLPYGEYEDRLLFQGVLERALIDFCFHEHHFSISLAGVTCIPEGGGHIMTLSSNPDKGYSQMRLSSLMLGMRDASVVTFHLGKKGGVTAPLGLNAMISQVIERSSQRDRDLLAKVIHQMREAVKPKGLKPVLLSRESANQRLEAFHLAKIVKQIRKEYWQQLQDWMLAHIPSDSEVIVVGGGTAIYWQPELSDFLPTHWPLAEISWHAGQADVVAQTFGVNEQDALVFRLTDVWALACLLRKQLLPGLEVQHV